MTAARFAALFAVLLVALLPLAGSIAERDACADDCGPECGDCIACGMSAHLAAPARLDTVSPTSLEPRSTQRAVETLVARTIEHVPLAPA